MILKNFHTQPENCSTITCSSHMKERWENKKLSDLTNYQMTLCGYFHREKTGDCAYDFRHRHIQLRKKLMLNTLYIHCKTSESVLNKKMDNYSFKYIDNLLFFFENFWFWYSQDSLVWCTFKKGRFWAYIFYKSVVSSPRWFGNKN